MAPAAVVDDVRLCALLAPHNMLFAVMMFRGDDKGVGRIPPHVIDDDHARITVTALGVVLACITTGVKNTAAALPTPLLHA